MHSLEQDLTSDPRVVERLLILAEECAEVQQEAMKVLRFGTSSSWNDGPTNIERLTKEIGDLQGMIDELIAEGIIDAVEVACSSVKKRKKILDWMSNP